MHIYTNEFRNTLFEHLVNLRNYEAMVDGGNTNHVTIFDSIYTREHIDARIFWLIRLLNMIGIETFTSCECNEGKTYICVKGEESKRKFYKVIQPSCVKYTVDKISDSNIFCFRFEYTDDNILSLMKVLFKKLEISDD
jgi:hypothetical protein